MATKKKPVKKEKVELSVDDKLQLIYTVVTRFSKSVDEKLDLIYASIAGMKSTLDSLYEEFDERTVSIQTTLDRIIERMGKKEKVQTFDLKNEEDEESWVIYQDCPAHIKGTTYYYGGRLHRGMEGSVEHWVPNINDALTFTEREEAMDVLDRLSGKWTKKQGGSPPDMMLRDEEDDLDDDE
jgi:hypothetical protein